MKLWASSGRLTFFATGFGWRARRPLTAGAVRRSVPFVELHELVSGEHSVSIGIHILEHLLGGRGAMAVRAARSCSPSTAKVDTARRGGGLSVTVPSVATSGSRTAPHSV